MTIYQQAHEKIDRFPEETVLLFIQLMDMIETTSDSSSEVSKKKSRFLASAGKINIDEKAVAELREASIV